VLLERKTIIEEGRSSCLRVKREHDSIDLRAQNIMKGIVEPSIVPIVVRAMPIVVHATKQTVEIPHMTTP
jgi:hypothetical protein